MIVIDKLTKKYKNTKAIDCISMRIPNNSIVGLVGPNGAGKSTLIKILIGLLDDYDGEYSLEEKATPRWIRQNIGYLPEQRGLYDDVDIETQLLYFASLRGMSKRTAQKNVQEWLKKFDIETWRHKHLSELSKGMQQKIQFICCLVHNPHIIFMDEPFSGIDPLNLDNFISVIKDYAKEFKPIILLSTHNMDSIERLCTHVAIIVKSKLILFDTTENVKQSFSKETTFEIILKDDVDAIRRKANENSNYFHVFSIEEKGNAVTILLELKSIDTINKAKILVDTFGMFDIISFNKYFPTMNDVFVKAVQENS